MAQSLRLRNGNIRDMGCHIYDPTKVLGLTYPISLRSEGPKPNKDNWGFDAIIHHIPEISIPKKDSPSNLVRRNSTTTWEIVNLVEGQKLPSQGSVVVGTKGIMLIPHVGMPKLFPQKRFKDFQMEVVKATSLA